MSCWPLSPSEVIDQPLELLTLLKLHVVGKKTSISSSLAPVVVNIHAGQSLLLTWRSTTIWNPWPALTYNSQLLKEVPPPFKLVTTLARALNSNPAVCSCWLRMIWRNQNRKFGHSKLRQKHNLVSKSKLGTGGFFCAVRSYTAHISQEGALTTAMFTIKTHYIQQTKQRSRWYQPW